MQGAYLNGYVDEAARSIVLFSRGEDGARRVTREPAEWSAFFREGSLSAQDLRLVSRVARSVTQEGPWLRVSFPDPETRRSICLRERNRFGVENPTSIVSGQLALEADVDPIRRFFSDTGAGIQRPRRAYLDIETDSRLPFSRKEEMRVLCWTVCDDELNTVQGVLEADDDRAEKELLHALYEQLDAYDQVSGWYGDGFDFPVIEARADLLDVPFDSRKITWLDMLVAYRRMNMHAAESAEEKRSFKLHDFAMATIGEGKTDFNAAQTWDYWRAGGDKRRELARYNRQDTLLLPKIERKKGYLDLFFGICEVCRLFPSTGSLYPTRQMDGFLLRLARERGHHFPSRKLKQWGDEEKREDDEEEDQFKGAYVVPVKSLDPEWRRQQGMTDGFLRNVHVGDFKSMYPSIIISWNMSVETRAPEVPVNGPIPPNRNRCPKTGTGFATDAQGLLPIACVEMLKLRKVWQDKEAQCAPGTPEWHEAHGRSNAYKVVPNSFFGASGNEYSRYHCRAIAEGITQNGVWLAQNTIAAAEARGWIVVYGDTDSIYVMGPSEDEFRAFVKWCNAELYPKLLASCGCTENRVSLDYDKAFATIVFTAKKRYVGKYLHSKGKRATKDSKPEVKGLEWKRGDWSRLTTGLLGEVIHMVADEVRDLGAYHELLTRARAHVLEGDLALEEIVKSQGLNQSIGKFRDGRWVDAPDGYKQRVNKDGTPGALPTHVAIARKLYERGHDMSVGTRVEYVIVDDVAEDKSRRAIAAVDYAGECDRHYVWEKLVYPPTYRLLEAAFPDDASHWKAWSRTRPRRSRKGRAVPDEQGGLFTAEQVPTQVGTLRSLPLPPLPRRSSAA